MTEQQEELIYENSTHNGLYINNMANAILDVLNDHKKQIEDLKQEIDKLKQRIGETK